LRRFDVAHLNPDFNGFFHASTKDGDFAIGLNRCFNDLLDAVDVRGERRDDYAALNRSEQVFDGFRNDPLGSSEIFQFRVGGIGEGADDAACADGGDFLVGSVASCRRKIKLEVAGMNDDAGGRFNGDAERIRNRVVGAEKPNLEVLESEQ